MIEIFSFNRHVGERKVRHQEDEVSSVISAALDTLNMNEDLDTEQEIDVDDGDDDEISEDINEDNKSGLF